MKLRPYQKEAVDAVMSWIKNNTKPCCIEAITSFGKSYVVADLAHKIHAASGKKVLCIQPSKELVQQNFNKFALTGEPASIYCASISKSLRHDVIFCTPMSIKPIINKLNCAAVILDECHLITATVKGIIASLKAANKNLRVIGMTSTPYRLGTGYIYKADTERLMEHAIDPYFERKVYTSDPRDLLEMGYLSPIVIGSINSEKYDVSNLEIKSGRFTPDSVRQAFVGHGRKTAAIIADVVRQSQDSRCTLIFASTVQHAQECLASLPEGSHIVTGDTARIERENTIKGMQDGSIRYVVNVSTLTTGLDVPHIECVAILRATESSALLSQILGRGMRVCDGKSECLVLDYAENIDRHYPEGDIFKPRISVRLGGDSLPVDVKCPLCHVVNDFKLRPNEDGYGIDDELYFTDLDGIRVLDDGDNEIPAHYGRRCFGFDRKNIRCDYRWLCKDCPECDADNDIAARYCRKCKAEIVDPNAKLIADYVSKKKDPTRLQCDEVLSVDILETLTRKGDKMHTITFALASRNIKLYLPDLPYSKAQAKRHAFASAYKAGIKTISYLKIDDFWQVTNYNEVADEIPQRN